MAGSCLPGGFNQPAHAMVLSFQFKIARCVRAGRINEMSASFRNFLKLGPINKNDKSHQS